ncbi:hypothetical protein ES692_17375 [Psychroserpens burtonensis]|uniref:Lipocalin-like domain-containing protein n=1 Tax=Psychroserpens burtonensis TaxID=49278 RepID=A0A5C7B3H4_9FLAO|nr:hypothetical protein [Psychroserpens burtonensis]TXE15285.1 hypothetical protein ES692_17375 [Psychroserpens burtonensis]
MRNSSVWIVMVFSLLACSDDDKTKRIEIKLLGTWQLSEVYSDPGDGSGYFTSIDSEKILTFLSSGTINSNA